MIVGYIWTYRHKYTYRVRQIDAYILTNYASWTFNFIQQRQLIYYIIILAKVTDTRVELEDICTSYTCREYYARILQSAYSAIV